MICYCAAVSAGMVLLTSSSNSDVRRIVLAGFSSVGNSILNPYVPNSLPAKLLLQILLLNYLPVVLIPSFHSSISAFVSRRTPLHEVCMIENVHIALTGLVLLV